jgi:hypothetical protein
MTTEARLRRQGRTLNNLISWYSFSAIVVALVELSGSYKITHSNIGMAALAVGIFAASLYANGEHYSERANQFKECYLELQEIYSCSASDREKMRRYAISLKRFENQTDMDYDEMLFDAFFRNQNLENASGSFRISSSMMCLVATKRFVRFCSTSILFLTPVVGFIHFVHPV